MIPNKPTTISFAPTGQRCARTVQPARTRSAASPASASTAGQARTALWTSTTAPEQLASMGPPALTGLDRSTAGVRRGRPVSWDSNIKSLEARISRVLPEKSLNFCYKAFVFCHFNPPQIWHCRTQDNRKPPANSNKLILQKSQFFSNDGNLSARGSQPKFQSIETLSKFSVWIQIQSTK